MLSFDEESVVKNKLKNTTNFQKAIIKYSGGLIKNKQHANLLMIVVVGICILFIVLTLKNILGVQDSDLPLPNPDRMGDS